MRVQQETELYGPVRDFLAAQGFTVRAEVGGCDVVGVRGQDVVVVELKRHLTVELLAQAVRRQQLTDAVYVALPRPDTPARAERRRDLLPLLRRLELGVLEVDVSTGAVHVVRQPLPWQRRRDAKRRRALLAEVASRSSDGNVGGGRGRKLLTAYRERAIHVAVTLELLGPSTPRRLRALGTGPQTLAILRDDVYGWFERVDRGVYRVRPAAAEGVARWPEVADRKRRAVKEALASEAAAP